MASEYKEHTPTSVLLHTAGSCIGLAGVIASVWWLNKNPLNLNESLITGLVIVFILFLAMYVMVESIAHSHIEKNYGYDPLKKIVFT